MDSLLINGLGRTLDSHVDRGFCGSGFEDRGPRRSGRCDEKGEDGHSGEQHDINGGEAIEGSKRSEG